MEKSKVALILLLMYISVFYPQSEVHSFTTPSDHDFRYMKFVYNATDLPLEEEYDYIVVGGGTAGCPLAATLSANYSVLLLERGNVPSAYPSVLSEDGILTTLMEEDDGNTPAERFTSEDGVANVRGRILGGASMINIGLYSRADQEFYAKSGIQWDMDLVNKAYQWVESTIVYHPNLARWQSVVKEGLLEAGVGPNNGFTLDHIEGTKITGSLFDNLGRRHGAVELLNKGETQNLRVAVHATVERILFTSNASSLFARGVMYSDSHGKSHRAFVRDKGEILLSAGAIGSPQLLLLSGVGPMTYLSSLKIPVVLPQLYIGQFMRDSPRNYITILPPSPLEPSSAHIVGPLSYGSLKLQSSSDAKLGANVSFNYFAHPADLAHCISGVRKIADLLNTSSLRAFKAQSLPGIEGFNFFGLTLPMNHTDVASLETFCRDTVATFWHYHGGCLVGKVVDGGLRVMGINKLRVVDGSVFNLSPGTNPQATLMMIGRYVGLNMLKERSACKECYS